MTGTTEDLIRYRLSRAWDTLDDARILSENEKVMPYFEPVKELITLVEKRINARH